MELLDSTRSQFAIPATSAAEKTPRSASERTERTLLPQRLCWMDTQPLLKTVDGIQFKNYQSTNVEEVILLFFFSLFRFCF